MVVALLLYVPARLTEVSRGWHERRARSTATVIANASANALMRGDVVEVTDLFRGLASSHEISSAVARLEDGTVLARWAAPASPAHPANATARFQVVSPIAVGGLPVGSVTIGFSMQELEEENARTLLTAGLSGLVVLLIGFGSALLVARFVLRRKQAEEARLRSEASFGSVIASSPDAIFIEREGRLVYLNPSARRFLGLGDEVTSIDRGLADCTQESARERVAEAMRPRPVGSAPTSLQEVAFPRADGTLLVAEMVALAISFQDQPATLALARDITERHELQRRVGLTERLTALGRLSSGIGHEINNPLTFIVGNLEYVSGELGDGPPSSAALLDMKQALGDAREGAERIRRIVDDLRTFARGEVGTDGVVQLRSVVELALKMADNFVRHRARVVRAYSPVPNVVGNASRLGQVVLNLLMNAAEAIPEGAVDANEVLVSLSTDEAGQVVLEVADTGSGIDPATLPHIFDPFFTTKGVGGGTGLGLSIAHGIVSDLGGEITAHSVVGKGSRLRVTLKPTQEPQLPIPQPAVSPRPPPGSLRPRILVVDDEPLVGATIRRGLSQAYEVICVASPREVLDRAGRGERYDLVLCDLMMPEMSGMQLTEALRKAPVGNTMRFAYMSGGAFSPDAAAFAEHMGAAVLHKPFQMVDLVSFVEKRLSRPVPPPPP